MNLVRRIREARLSIKHSVYALLLVLVLVVSGSATFLLWQNYTHGEMSKHLNDFHLRAIGHAQSIAKHVSLVEKYSLLMDRGLAAEVYGKLLSDRRASLFTMEKSFVALDSLQRKYGHDPYRAVTEKARRQLIRIKGDAAAPFDWGKRPALEKLQPLRNFENSVEQLERLHANGYQIRAAAMTAREDNVTRSATLVIIPLLILGLLATLSILRSIDRTLARQRDAENALRESEDQHRGLVELSPDGIFVLVSGRIVYANETGAAMCGVEKHEDVIGAEAIRFVHPDHREKAISLRSQILTGNVPGGATAIRRVRADGSEFDTESSSTRIIWDGEQAQLLVVRDVSERRKMEDVTARLGRILEDSVNEIYIFDAQTLRFIQVNRGARENLGYTMEELNGITAFDIKPEVPEDKFHEIIRPLLDAETELLIFETVHERKDGSRYDVNVRLQYMAGEDPPLFVAIIEDITERKQIDRELHENQDRLQTVMDHIADGIVTINEDGIVESVNPAAAWIFGYEEEELIGSNVKILMPDPDQSGHDGYLEAYRKTGKGTMMGVAARQVSGLRKQGDTVPLEIAIAEMRVAGERKFIGTLRDVSERERAEEEIRRMNEDLEIRVHDRTRQLEHSNTELQTTLESLQQTQEQLIQAEKLSALGGLVAGVAHEINTPIGIGVTAASHLHEHTENLRLLYADNKITRANLEKYIETGSQSSQIILSNLERASDLIRSFKQVAVDQSSEDKRRFNLRGYTEEVLTSLRPKLKQGGHSVTIDGGEDIDVSGYPGAFAQIVTNLVMNSVTHAYDEGEAGNLRFTFDESDGQVTMFYADDGKGIPADHLPKIFDPFFTTRRGDGGTGLGLNIIANLISKSLDGTIICDSELGKGTTFLIRFPSDAQIAEPAGEAAA